MRPAAALGFLSADQRRFLETSREVRKRTHRGTPVPVDPRIVQLTPRAPNIDESRRRPANTRAAIDVQVCSGDLQDARSSLAACLRVTEAARTTLSRLAARRNTPSATCASGIGSRSTVHFIVFPFAGSRVNLSPAQGDQLIRAARTAPLILLRGRTDGTADNLADSRIARERAEAVRAYLVAAGIRPAQIRTTWQPVGDFVVDNSTPNGRVLNRTGRGRDLSRGAAVRRAGAVRPSCTSDAGRTRWMTVRIRDRCQVAASSHSIARPC